MCTSAAAGATAPAPAPAEELPCGPAPGASASATKPLLGGYSSLNLTTAPLVTQQLVPIAWQSYAGSNAVGGCAAGTARLSSAYVKRACQQVRHRARIPFDLCYCLAELCREQRHGGCAADTARLSSVDVQCTCQQVRPPASLSSSPLVSFLALPDSLFRSQATRLFVTLSCLLRLASLKSGHEQGSEPGHEQRIARLWLACVVACGVHSMR